MLRNMCTIVCTAESPTELRIPIPHTFRNDMEKRNRYQFKNRRRRPFRVRHTIYHIYQG
jgi:hypothetical protein